MTEPTSFPPASGRMPPDAGATSAPLALPAPSAGDARTSPLPQACAPGSAAALAQGSAEKLAQGSAEKAAQEAAGVAAWLRAHPDFLASQPALYASMAPPRRVHGAIFADHMDAMLREARVRAAAMAEKADTVLAAARAAAAIAERVQEAVLAALAAPDPVEFVGETLPGLLGVDAASLASELPKPRWRRLPPGLVHGLLRNRPVVFRNRPADAALLHAEAALLAERDILVALPGSAPALLALVSRDAAALPAQQGMQALAFLGRVLATLLHP